MGVTRHFPGMDTIFSQNNFFKQVKTVFATFSALKLEVDNTRRDGKICGFHTPKKKTISRFFNVFKLQLGGVGICPLLTPVHVHKYRIMESYGVEQLYPQRSTSLVLWRKRCCPLNWPHCMHVCTRPCCAVRSTAAAVAGERSCARACTCVLRFTPIFPIIGVINHKYQCIKIGSLAALSFAGVCWSKFLHL